jgi:spermidine synthase
LDSCLTPDKKEELKLFQRGEEFSIRVAGLELMNSRVFASEIALAKITCKCICNKANANVLVGGLGMGFTLSAALKNLGNEAHILLAELVPSVVEWNKIYLGKLSGCPLEDSRVTVLIQDVIQLLKSEKNRFDAVMLDVDNSPGGLTQKGNDWLYGLPGLAASRQALKPGGVLSVWSAIPDKAFTERLKKTGFSVEEHKVRAREGGKGSRHNIWVAQKA